MSRKMGMHERQPGGAMAGNRAACNNSSACITASNLPGSLQMFPTTAIHRDLLRRRLAVFACGLMLSVLAGCAAFSPRSLPLGLSQAEVIGAMGPPTGYYPLAEGHSRLEFARGPAAQETFMVDFDATGRMIGWKQVLSLQHFAEIEPGTSAQELLMRIGHPGSTTTIARQQLVLWNYRYPTNDCLWYQFSVGFDGRVISGSTGIDPRCDPPNFMRW